jgi:hypothetical protein
MMLGPSTAKPPSLLPVRGSQALHVNPDTTRQTPGSNQRIPTGARAAAADSDADLSAIDYASWFDKMPR